MRISRLNPFVCTVFATLLLSACGASRPQSGEESSGDVVMVWPPAPAPARIRYVRSITTPQDLGIRKSIFRRLLNKFTGGSGSHFGRPSGVAERDGVAYVADPGAHMLWILDLVNNRTTGVHEIGGVELVSPVAVAVRADGAVFVADSVAGKVLLLDRQGNYLGVAAQAGLQRPAGLAYDDGNGRLYVADSVGQRIVVYGSDGEKLFSWGERGNGEGQFNYPTHLVFSHGGELLVTDALNFRIQSFDRNGKFLWQFGDHGDSSGSFASPKGVAVDSGRHVYVVDALFDAVQLFETDGTFLLSFGGRGSGPGEFWLPGSLFINAQDRIFVADAYNHRIQVFEFLHPAPQSSPDRQP